MKVCRTLNLLLLTGLLLACVAPPAPAAQLSFDTLREGELGAEIVVQKGERREQDIHVVWGDVQIEGELDGDVEVTFGTLEISGIVEGDVTTVGGKLVISGVVNGDVETMKTEVVLEDGARIEGRFTSVLGTEERKENVHIKRHERVRGPQVNVGFPFIGWNLGMGFIGLIVLVLAAGLFPARVEQMGGFLDLPGRWIAAPFVGLATLVAVILMSTALCATIVGTLLVPFLLLGFWLAGYFGLAAFYLVIGRTLLLRLRSAGPGGLLAPIVFAYLLFRIPGLIPCLCVLVFLLGQLLCLFGVGLAVMTAFGQRGGWHTVGSRKPPRRSESEPPVPPLADEEEDEEEDDDDDDDEEEDD